MTTDPQLVAGSGSKEEGQREFAAWRRLAKNASAVKQQQFASIDGDLIGRMGPRFVDGAAALCEAIEQARRPR